MHISYCLELMIVKSISFHIFLDWLFRCLLSCFLLSTELLHFYVYFKEFKWRLLLASSFYSWFRNCVKDQDFLQSWCVSGPVPWYQSWDFAGDTYYRTLVGFLSVLLSQVKGWVTSNFPLILFTSAPLEAGSTSSMCHHSWLGYCCNWVCNWSPPLLFFYV